MRVRIKITVDPDRYKKLKQRFETVSVAFAASLFIVAAFAGLAGVFGSVGAAFLSMIECFGGLAAGIA
ncbi:hypothetical protein [Allobaculum mucilyticum]|uniref:hypothetical protein n=1 Tax=Allobaculum mucilyticum TaxID=2834459 RepID=UPI001E54A4A1|nr:hypothetical protein [Allobaculum mucilyticum]UNT96005.1 hypothetical protein KWG62_12090 [Allobaculum mucilyticum]